MCLSNGALIASPNDLEILKQIGYKIGLAFQIQDDILDVTSDAKTLGKNTGSDEANHKETYVTLLGIENSQKKLICYLMKLSNLCIL